MKTPELPWQSDDKCIRIELRSGRWHCRITGKRGPQRGGPELKADGDGNSPVKAYDDAFNTYNRAKGCYEEIRYASIDFHAEFGYQLICLGESGGWIYVPKICCREIARDEFRIKPEHDKTNFARANGYTAREFVWVVDGKVISHGDREWHEWLEEQRSLQRVKPLAQAICRSVK